MSLILVGIVLVGCVILLALELRGVRTTLQLSFRGDVKRETAFLAQYGQSVATPLAAIIAWQFHPQDIKTPIAIVSAVLSTSISCMILKRLLGRVRPNRENAGKFLGPSFKHANHRESFPSSHSACAIALTVALSCFFPQAKITWWVLAIITALLRYVLDAHWPSDVLGGVALGYVVAYLVLRGFGYAC
ncbi:MAG TPA: phosphatase PAP2 family protein [Tepidisphaeraceae bacterium]|jgi:membrane-associated phospholipid phosphatase|nr:phosphatase PAP2 family protein [Tepidisphaeraceae bacterium]